MTERDPERGDGRDPIDEEAAWAQIVAGYGAEPADPPGVWPARDQLDLTDTVDRVPQPVDARGDGGERVTESETSAEDLGDGSEGQHESPSETESASGTEPPSEPPPEALSEGEFPSEAGPRDWEPAEQDEGHFVPPEPPPLPPGDLTTRLAWVAVLGGPLLLFGGMLLQWEMTWWLATLGIGGFLGGFATLVVRMRGDEDDDDEWPDRGSGAVV